MRLFSISVDLDEIASYSAIHGLEVSTECHAVYDVAVTRILEFSRSLAVPLTLFVIARDLDRDQNIVVLRRAVSDGHEIGNHSLDHLFDLTRREQSEQRRQVLEASKRIHTRLGVRPSGFRAPGYTMSDDLISVLHDAGFSYDSSVFPCPAYYMAKAAALVRMKLAGRVSKSILDNSNVLRASTTPYRTGKPYWMKGKGLLELPIQVAGPLRLPFIGTSLTLLGPGGARTLTRGLSGVPFINLELHGIDFLDASDVPAPLRAVQPDLRVPLTRKLDTLSGVARMLRSHGYSPVRLDEAARVIESALS